MGEIGEVERKGDVFIEGNRVSEVAVAGRFQNVRTPEEAGGWWDHTSYTWQEMDDSEFRAAESKC